MRTEDVSFAAVFIRQGLEPAPKRRADPTWKQFVTDDLDGLVAPDFFTVGVSDTIIARWLGHADTSMVHLHYGHLLAYHGDINRVQIGPAGPI